MTKTELYAVIDTLPLTNSQKQEPKTAREAYIWQVQQPDPSQITLEVIQGKIKEFQALETDSQKTFKQSQI